MNFKSIRNRIFNINATSIMGNFSKAINNLEDLRDVLETEISEKAAKAIKVEAKVADKIQRIAEKRDRKVAVLHTAAKDAEGEYKKTVKYLSNLKTLLEG